MGWMKLLIGLDMAHRLPLSAICYMVFFPVGTVKVEITSSGNELNLVHYLDPALPSKKLISIIAEGINQEFYLLSQGSLTCCFIEWDSTAWLRLQALVPQWRIPMPHYGRKSVGDWKGRATKG